MRHLFFVIIAGMWPGGHLDAQARMAVSQNMVACGALMDVTRLRARSPEGVALAEKAAQTWAEAAAKQAVIEGWIAEDLGSAYASKRTEWEALGPAFINSKEYRNWSSYCRALALRYQVPLP